MKDIIMTPKEQERAGCRRRQSRAPRVGRAMWSGARDSRRRWRSRRHSSGRTRT